MMKNQKKKKKQQQQLQQQQQQQQQQQHNAAALAAAASKTIPSALSRTRLTKQTSDPIQIQSQASLKKMKQKKKKSRNIPTMAFSAPLPRFNPPRAPAHGPKLAQVEPPALLLPPSPPIFTQDDVEAHKQQQQQHEQQQQQAKVPLSRSLKDYEWTSFSMPNVSYVMSQSLAGRSFQPSMVTVSEVDDHNNNNNNNNKNKNIQQQQAQQQQQQYAQQHTGGVSGMTAMMHDMDLTQQQQQPHQQQHHVPHPSTSQHMQYHHTPASASLSSSVPMSSSVSSTIFGMMREQSVSYRDGSGQAMAEAALANADLGDMDLASTPRQHNDGMTATPKMGGMAGNLAGVPALGGGGAAGKGGSGSSGGGNGGNNDNSNNNNNNRDMLQFSISLDASDSMLADQQDGVFQGDFDDDLDDGVGDFDDDFDDDEVIGDHDDGEGDDYELQFRDD